MNLDYISKIGIVEDNHKVIGLITYEDDIGEAYFCLDEKYEYLKPQLIDYAVNNLSSNGEIRIALPDCDLGYQQAVIIKGFYATNKKSSAARFDATNIDFVLPDGYKIISFDDEDFDVDKYYAAIWKGFDNKRERNELEMESMKKREGFKTICEKISV